MNKDKKEPEYPAELESQFILRLPEEPAKVLRELLKSGDNIKNRLTIQIENDMRQGEVRLDHWLMHTKIIDLPTIIESLKTIDNKSFYKTADICQMMICKEEPDQTQSEDETPKSKKKDPIKVDKKFLWPHGITPPTKNVRKRRFRKTLKKKYVEAPEIEKEVKRLLRADNEAFQLTWEVVKEEDEALGSKPEMVAPATPSKPEKKTKSGSKKATTKKTDVSNPNKGSSSNVVDIFGGAVSDSDGEENLNGPRAEKNKSGASAVTGTKRHTKKGSIPSEFESPILQSKKTTQKSKKSTVKNKRRPATVTTSTATTSTVTSSTVTTSTVTTSTVTSSTVTSSIAINSGALSPEEDVDYLSQDMSKDNMTLRIEQLRTELEELKQRRQRTQHEIAGMENMTLRQRFQDILHTLNQDVMYKEMEYQGLITLQNSEDI